MSDVRLENVTKAFKETIAVDDVTLTVGAGEFFSLLGPSGCGKTTTLRMIGGFEEPTAGRIQLGGRDVTGVPPYRRDVNTVFQSYALFPHLNVYDNVAFGLNEKRVERSEVKRRVAEALSLVDLEGYDKRRPSQLSGGQQQRVALARAVINRPQVLLLDEPLGALDLKLRKQMQLELKRIQQEVGITFIYVTHDQEEAMTMSNRLAVMRAGRIDQVGSPEDVYENPATEFVAGFLGASNLLDAELKERGDGAALLKLEDGATVSLPSYRLDGLDGRIRVGVRPEKISLQDPSRAAESDRNSIAGTVIVSTFVGVSHQYAVEGPGGATIMVFAQNLGGDFAPRPGDRVLLVWKPQHTFAVSASEARQEETV